MAKDARSRSKLAVTASAAAHIVVLAIAVAQHPTIPIPDTPEAPAPDAIVVQLVRLPPPAASPRSAPLRLHRPPTPVTEPNPPVAPLPAAAAARPGPAPPAIIAGPDLRLGLRQGPAGCANLAAVGMTRAERDRCNERLGRNMASEPFRPAAIEARMRAYYDQVALAKAPDPQPIRDISQGSGGAGPAGMFWADSRPTNGHGPGIGCHIVFGVGKKPPRLPHALYLGPCFIEPPKGSLSPEVDITPP